MFMNFGKYRGQIIEEVYAKNPGYFNWMKKNGMTDKEEYLNFIEIIPQQYPERFEWDIEIRDRYVCWKCKNNMKIILMYKPEKEYTYKDVIPIISECSYSKPDSIIPLAKKYGVLLEKRYSKFVNDKYIMHICPNCNMHQGDNFVVEDNHQRTQLLKQCRICFRYGKWITI
ncbi:hypothetical protein MOE15_00540 [Bacillus atrophaeus]|uniref:exodeoxyribonuclease X C-terminal domain-containing protein n=1 Tax=Bacillus atrophaeus TaxID=1452 RepID=UPI0022805959|nr:hypothetical protein [Bacillus atrophaeus]MCY8807031.1 hypothetical protein [Bacillus atrophaeus]